MFMNEIKSLAAVSISPPSTVIYIYFCELELLSDLSSHHFGLFVSFLSEKICWCRMENTRTRLLKIKATDKAAILEMELFVLSKV